MDPLRAKRSRMFLRALSGTLIGEALHIMVRKVVAVTMSLFSVGEAQYRITPLRKFNVL